jgi:murein DD-endopeptidase MepM/ murein hydrolase activator NlpD
VKQRLIPQFYLSLLILLLLSGCISALKVTLPHAPTRSSPPATATFPPTGTATIETTSTKTLPCSPDYCIEPGEFPFSRPILPPGNDRVEEHYRYGYTQSGLREPHHGVEFVNPVGTPVLAAAEGTVLYAGDDLTQVFGLYPGFYGNLVLLQHDLTGYDSPVYTLYGHLSSIAVKTGEQVSRGDVIGAVGLTGSAIGSHLHFEVRLGEPVYDHTTNPELFLPPLPTVDTEVPTGILTGRIEDQFGANLNIPISIQPLSPEGTLGQAVFPELYGTGIPSNPRWNENFLLGDLPAGKYRVAFVNYSKVFERTVEVIPGDVIFVKMTATP